MRKTAVLLIASCLASAVACAAPAPLPPSPFGICGLKPRYAKTHPKLWSIVDELGNYMEDAGLRWDRAEITWDDVQSAPDSWNWTFTDRMIQEYPRRNMNAFVLLQGKAPWMAAPPKTDEERRQFAEFVYRVVDRYKGTVRAWEIWNEPNIPNFWPEPNAREYALLLKAAYEAAKRADPGCTIIAGSTSGVDLGFLREMLDAGGWEACDAVSVHPYSMSGNPTTQGLPHLLRQTKAAVTRDGVAKPLWITEVGWATDGSKESERRQAVNLAQEYAIALAEGVRYVFWFTLGDWGEKWGLLAGKNNVPDWGYTSTTRTKPAFFTMKRLTERLSPTGKRPGFLGYMPGAEGAIVMAFLADGDPAKPVVVTWAPYGTRATVVLPPSNGRHALDALGKTVAIENNRIIVSEVPVLIRGFQAGTLKGATLQPENDPFRTAGVILNANPSFELADGRQPAFWNRGRFPDASKDATLTWATTGRTGSRSIETASGKDGAWHSAPVTVEQDRSYTLRAWAKPDGAGEHRLRLEWYSGNMWTMLGAVESDPISGEEGWREVVLTGEAPRNAVHARINMVSKNATGTIQWDDVTLVQD